MKEKFKINKRSILVIFIILFFIILYNYELVFFQNQSILKIFKILEPDSVLSDNCVFKSKLMKNGKIHHDFYKIDEFKNFRRYFIGIHPNLKDINPNPDYKSFATKKNLKVEKELISNANNTRLFRIKFIHYIPDEEFLDNSIIYYCTSLFKIVKNKDNEVVLIEETPQYSSEKYIPILGYLSVRETMSWEKPNKVSEIKNKFGSFEVVVIENKTIVRNFLYKEFNIEQINIEYLEKIGKYLNIKNISIDDINKFDDSIFEK